MKFKQTKVLGVIIGWELRLTHKETHAVAKVGATAAVLPGVPPQVRVLVGAVSIGLEAICAAGGHDGVRIFWSPAVNPNLPIVLPR